MFEKLYFRDYNPKPILLFPRRLDEDIAEDDPVRVVDSVIDHLKLDNFKKLYKERGRSPYHPKMMLKAIVYGYMNNLYSCRKIASALRRDIHFIWLAMRNPTTTPSTVSATALRRRLIWFSRRFCLSLQRRGSSHWKLSISIASR